MNTTNVAFSTAGIISLLIGTVLPILVGYVTKRSLNPGLKSAILAGISAVSGVLSQWLGAINNHHHFVWQAAVLSAFATWAVAEAAYYKWWKPSGLSDVVQAKGNADPQPVTNPVDAGVDASVGSAVDSATPAVNAVEGHPKHLAH